MGRKQWAIDYTVYQISAFSLNARFAIGARAHDVNGHVFSERVDEGFVVFHLGVLTLFTRVTGVSR